jgi:ATP-dependent Clp protease adapter protein ClpS
LIPVAQFYTTRGIPVKSRAGRDPESANEAPELYEVRIIDNDYNTYQEVIDISMAALGISQNQAFRIAWEVDHVGYCVVAHAPYETAVEIAEVIRTIGIEVRVSPVEGPVQ